MQGPDILQGGGLHAKQKSVFSLVINSLNKYKVFTISVQLSTNLLAPRGRGRYFQVFGYRSRPIGSNKPQSLVRSQPKKTLSGLKKHAFVVATVASLLGGLVFVLLGPKIKRQSATVGPVSVC